MAEAGPITPADAAAAEWLRAAARGFFESIYNAEVASARGIDHVELKAAADRMTEAAKSALWDDVDKTFNQIRALLPDFPFAVIAWILTQVLGLTISAEQIKTITTGSPTDADRIAFGRTLTTLYRETLPTADVAQGFRDRLPGTAEFTNFERLSGAAMRLQVADMVLDWLGRKIPLGLGDILQDLADLFNNAIALDDALEEVVQVPMQAVIQRGMEAKYNREIKPADLSNSEAYQAYIAGKIDQGTLTKILDNSGLRDDIREIQLDFAASNLTESDINEAYQRNLLSIEQVSDEYKNKFFQERERKIKTDLVKGTRRWQLQTKVVELLGNMYRDAVATRAECDPYLNFLGFEDDEKELWFLQQELERKQRKWLTNAQLEDMLEAGRISLAAARDYQVLQGMTEEDANRLYVEVVTQKAIAKLPKAVRDECAEILKPEQVLTQLLGELLQLTGLGGLADQKLRELVNCLITKLGLP